jgi:hypothetical protein
MFVLVALAVAPVEYEITARVLSARLPESMGSFCTFSVTYPST